MSPTLGCGLCKKPIELGREPWTKRVLPTTRRESVVCERCAKGLDGHRDLEARIAQSLDEDSRPRCDETYFEPPRGTL